jgi:HD-GYP domain-containing protein (c-di-GMP phosphodiesterase class II)
MENKPGLAVIHGVPEQLFAPGTTLSQRLEGLHAQLMATVTVVDRIACAIYDPAEDLLKTFINSTRSGEAITAYQFKLSDSPSLSRLAKSGEFRVLEDIPSTLAPNTPHSTWVLKQGYQSSFTVPMFDGGGFIGFIFFDALTSSAFTPAVQRDLGIYCTLINMALSNELSAVRTIVGSARVAREFSDLRDFETGAHLERMAHYSRLIAKSIAPVYSLNDEFVEHVYLFAPLHDIGKIGIPDRILLKPGRLDPEERRIMEGHVNKGLNVLEKVLGDFGVQNLPDSVIMRNIVGGHHEYLDGSGYPNGLKGDAVAIESRIVTVADIFDALTSPRPYKKAWSIEESLEELERLVTAGKIDRHCVAAIRDNAAEVAAIAERHQD